MEISIERSPQHWCPRVVSNSRPLDPELDALYHSATAPQPLKDKGFMLDKQTFWDSIFIRSYLPIPRLPSKCECGKQFTIDHALSFMKGGFISLRHNELRDFTAELLSECCKDVSVEPVLQPLTGETLPSSSNKSDEARVDIAARVFWVKGQKAYFDVRVFNPTAKTYRNQGLSSIHRSNEQAKKCAFDQRIQQIEYGSLTPLVFTCFGGMSRECSTFYSRLTEKIADKRKERLSKTINWIRTRTSFHLIRSYMRALHQRK